MQAIFQGLSDQDLAGPSSALGPGGGKDWRISLTGLKATPTRITISGATGGLWVSPSNHSNWTPAVQVLSPTAVDCYFEPWGDATEFTVIVDYPDSTQETTKTVLPGPVVAPFTDEEITKLRAIARYFK